MTKLIPIIILFFLNPTCFAQSLDNKYNDEIIIAEPEPTEETKDSLTVYGYGQVAKNAIFIGGQDSLRAYLSNQLRYPVEALRKNWEGTVYISFVIEKNGSISKIKLVRGCNYAPLNKEAISLIYNMPKWNPAKLKNDTKVRQRITLPIRFKISE